MIYHRCPCGLAYDRAAWLALPFVGVGVYEFEAGVLEAHENRNCGCGSTMSRAIASSAKVTDDPDDIRTEHAAMLDALVACQRRASELQSEGRRARQDVRMILRDLLVHIDELLVRMPFFDGGEELVRQIGRAFGRRLPGVLRPTAPRGGLLLQRFDEGFAEGRHAGP